YRGPMPDVFGPEFARRAKVTVGVVAEEVKGNPWCIGVFIDNEKSWGMPGTTKGQYGIVLDALSMKSSESPVKAEFTKLLRKKYSSVKALNNAWGTKIKSWSALKAGVNYKNKGDYNDAMVADFSMLLEAYATKYFQIVHDALTEVMPNHMYLGCRFATWGMSEEVRAAAKKYVDVFSYNYYKEALSPSYWKFLEGMDRPSIIGEWHIGTMASGMFHPGLVEAASHEDRARMYKRYMQTVIDNPYFVGAHWFQYIDSPTSGRAHDGENYNVGFVRITDVPYASMVKAIKEFNKDLYPNVFGKK
ncbi:MAG: beta-agarase, partial [Calditrichaeota bacterium]